MEKIHDFTDVRQLWGDVATKIDNNFAELAGKTGMLADLGKVASDEEAFSQAAVLAENTGVCLICWHTDIESGYILQSAITPSVVMQLRLATDANGTSYMRKVQNGEAGGWTEWPAGGVDEPSVEADADTVTLKNGADALYELAGASEEKAGIVTADDYSRMLNKQVVNMGDVPDEEGLIEKIKILCDLNTPRIVVYERGKGDGATFYQGWLMLYNNVNGLKKHVVCFEASGNDDTYKNFCVYNFNHKDRDDWGYVNKFELGDGAVAQEALETANSAQHTAETAKSDAETAKSTAETAKQTAEGAKASAEGLTGDVTAMGLAQSVLTDYAGTGEPVAAGAGAVSVLTSTLKSGELVPWHGWFTLVACYTTTDGGAQIGVSGRHGDGAEQVIVPMTTIAAGERAVARVTADPGTRTVALEGGDAVELRKLTAAQGFTLHWAVLYESDEYGNPRRRGGSLRQYIETFPCVDSSVKFSSDDLLKDHIRYNENTGLFEMNGVQDLTWDDVLLIVSETPTKGISSNAALNLTEIQGRTNVLACKGSSGQAFNNFNAVNAEVIARENMIGYPGAGYLFVSSMVKIILGMFNMHYNGTGNENSFCTGLENVKIFDPRFATAFNFKSSNISYDCLKYFIDTKTQNESAYTACTITVTEAVYNKLTGGTIENWGALATLASGKNITLLAKGDSGYPYLTEPFYRSYIGLYNKINSAANGSTIYIHTQDKQKITSSQQDDWGTLVTLAAEKNITFAQAE